MKRLKIRNIKSPIRVCDRHNHGKVKYIDFTYPDDTIVWVQYKNICRAYRSQ